MIDKEDIVASVIAAFKERGFTYVGRSSTNDFVLTGPLHTSEGSHECVLILPRNFDSPPSISLREVPEALRPIAPHIDSSGSICYLSKQLVALDIFDPIGQMLGCVARAELVLGQLLRNELIDDLAEEFFAYWGNEKLQCFFDFRIGKLQKLKSIIDVSCGTKKVVVFVTDDVNRTLKKSKALGYNPALTHVAERIYTKVEPRPIQLRWPPVTLGDIVHWQSSLDPRSCRRIVERVSQAAERGEDYLTVMIESPRFFYAFVVSFRRYDKRPSNAQLRKKSVLLSSLVVPLRGWRIDEDYIIRRNVPSMKTLEHKKIVLVGCGTIGGYLADMLVKAGAGAGTGELVLIDSDFLGAGNLGRHRLGFSYIGHEKADALRDELKRDMPDAKIRSIAVDVKDANVANADLIIDATGEQTVSDYIASRHASTEQLNVWIEGPGVAVRALIRRNRDEACVQCLTRLVRQGQHATVVEKVPNVYAGYGCENEYVPFPASVSMQAACLASEMVMDWVAGKNSPGLRTQVISRAFTKSQEDCTLMKTADCPACST